MEGDGPVIGYGDTVKFGPLGGSLQVPVVVATCAGALPKLKGRKLGVVAQLKGDPLFFLERIPDDKYSWWSHLKRLFLRVEQLGEGGHEYFLSSLPGSSSLFRLPDPDQLERALGEAAILFQSTPVKCEMAPLIEAELHAMGRPNGLEFAAFVARTEGFMELLAPLTELKKRNPDHEGGDFAYPGDVWYDHEWQDAGGWGFSARAAFQSLMVLFPKKVIVDESETILRGNKVVKSEVSP